MSNKSSAELQTTDEVIEFHKFYDEKSFWEKIAELAKKLAKHVVEKALWLYYAAESEETPEKARFVAYGALGYLILPVDAIPDFIPTIGYTDDLGVLTVALLFIAFHITPEVKEQARKKMEDIFGEFFEEESNAQDA